MLLTLSRWLRKAAAVAGRRLKDYQGRTLDRAFVFPWRGRILLLGLSPQSHLRPVGVPQKRLTYWVQALCWEQAEAPDFPRNGRQPERPPASKVCHVIITHLDAARNGRMVAEWKRLDPEALILLAHGGSREDFESLPQGVDAFYVEDPALRTRDHAREKQEYLGVIKAAATYLRDFPDISHIHLLEYDVVPMVSGLGQKLVACLITEDADLCGSGMYDLTGTVHPHLLSQADDQAIGAFLRNLSCREDKGRVLTMLGCTSIWTRACFESIARLEPPGRIYLEIASPTLAHHLGWRVRPLPEAQNRSLTFYGDLGDQADALANQGAWMIHPSKKRW